LFDPSKTVHDNATGETYVFDAETVLAIEIALTAGRPLLVLGPPGSGKSSLAAESARVLGWRYYEHRLSASSSLPELLYTFDMTRRGLDVQRGRLGDDFDYLNPGILWWAFDRKSARRRGTPEGQEPRLEAIEPLRPQVDVRVDQGVVVLIDDLDRAPAELTEVLLHVWATRTFYVEGIGLRITDESQNGKLLILTSGGERELSAALKRQCLLHTLSSPYMEKLFEIANAHGFGDDIPLVGVVAHSLLDRANAGRQPVSVAQFLDALRWTRQLGLQPDTPEWQAALSKQVDYRPSIVETGTPNRACRVFLCHSSGDKPAVRQLYHRLIEEGFDAWLDEENILPGQDWDDAIATAVEAADLVIVCLSMGSIQKTGYVQHEIKMVLDLAENQPEGKIFLIPAKLEECTMPRRLKQWQWVDLFRPNGYDRLLAAVWTAAQSVDLPPTEGELTARRSALGLAEPFT
jgi:MoxR-like ATPase